MWLGTKLSLVGRDIVGAERGEVDSKTDTPGTGHLHQEDKSHNIWLCKPEGLNFASSYNHQGLISGT